ncbi:Sec14 protein, putative [Plasmodium ovale curtisi]|uniref:Sec14 protein, putative n=1 Tax=Plasmodium ovale curtisi TaxID=864141 RepID=A0A1A8WMI4_PLAOA|nr:Sec14 protein, putative [Plasmodium ovale curtisi]
MLMPIAVADKNKVTEVSASRDLSSTIAVAVAAVARGKCHRQLGVNKKDSQVAIGEKEREGRATKETTRVPPNAVGEVIIGELLKKCRDVQASPEEHTMELSRGKVIVEKKVNEYTIDENVFFFEPDEDDVYDKNANLRYIFHNTFIHTEEEIAISEFKRYCKSKCLKINKAFFENECLRYLYSAQFDFAKAFDLIKSNYEFRLSPILPIKEKDIIEYINKGVMYWHGRDKKCRPIMIINLLNVELLDVEKLTNLFFFCFEFFLKYLCIPGKIENYISLIDCSGISISKFPMSTFMKLLEIMNSKYRCRLFRMYIIDAPKIFKTFGKSFLNFAPSYMTKKLKILDANYASYLREEILETQLEKKYGGVQEIRNSTFYPFAFYPECCVAKGKSANSEIHCRGNSDKVNIFNSSNERIYEFITAGYSMHLKLVDIGHRDLVRQQCERLNEEWNHITDSVKSDHRDDTHRRRRRRKPPSKRDLLINGCFVKATMNEEYSLDRANVSGTNLGGVIFGGGGLLKNSKYVNGKNRYIVNTGSWHKWLYKIRHLYLPNITIDYVVRRFPFLKNHLLVKSNYKSMYDYVKYIENVINTKEIIPSTPGNGKKEKRNHAESNNCYPSNVHTLSTSNTFSTYRNSEENMSTLVGSIKSLSSFTDASPKRESNKNTLFYSHRLKVNKKKFQNNVLQERCNLDDAKKKKATDSGAYKNVDIKFYDNSASIFEDDERGEVTRKECTPNGAGEMLRSYNKHKEGIEGSGYGCGKSRVRRKKQYKIKATNSLFKDEREEEQSKIENVAGGFLSKTGTQFNGSTDAHMLNFGISSNEVCSAETIRSLQGGISMHRSMHGGSYNRAANHVPNRMVVRMGECTINDDTINSVSWDQASCERQLTVGSQANDPKRMNFTPSKNKNDISFPSVSNAKLSQNPHDKVSEETHEKTVNLHKPANCEFSKEKHFSQISRSTGKVINAIKNDVVNDYANNEIVSHTSFGSVKKEKMNSQEKEKKKLKRIKMIGLQFFNKTTSRT